MNCKNLSKVINRSSSVSLAVKWDFYISVSTFIQRDGYICKNSYIILKWLFNIFIYYKYILKDCRKYLIKLDPSTA